jgi:hypothetical protein
MEDRLRGALEKRKGEGRGMACVLALDVEEKWGGKNCYNERKM